MKNSYSGFRTVGTFFVDSDRDLYFLFHHLDISEPIEILATMNDAAKRHLRLSVSQSQTDTEIQPPPIGSSQGETDQREVSVFGLSSSAPSAPHTLEYDTKIFDSQSRLKCSRESTIAVNSQNDIDLKITVNKNPRDGTIPGRFIRVGEIYSATIISELLVNKKKRNLIDEMLHFNDNISDIAMKKGMAYIDIGLDTMIPLNMFGTGLIRAAIIFSHCIVRNEKIVLIDELESGIHHRVMLPYLSALLRFSVGDGPQVFATSHSLEILKCLRDILSEDEHENMREEVLCHVLAKNKDGKVIAYTYDYEQFDHCIQHGIEIR